MKAKFRDAKRDVQTAYGRGAAEADQFELICNSLDTPLLPSAGESCAVAIENPKVAALCYDRVWDRPNADIPRSIAFHGSTVAEAKAIFTLSKLAYLDELRREDPGATHTALKVDDMRRRLPQPMSRQIAEELYVSHQLHAAAVFRTHDQKNREYTAGDQAAIVGMLEGALAINEEALSWKQVGEVRNDSESKIKLRRLMHWLDTCFVGKPRSFIEDEIAVRIDNYRYAMRKHGIELVLGTMSSIIDGKFLVGGAAATAAVTAAADAFSGLLSGGAILVGGAVITATRTLLNLREARHTVAAEIAFVLDIDKVAKPK